jgi:hypothetical protein
LDFSKKIFEKAFFCQMAEFSPDFPLFDGKSGVFLLRQSMKVQLLYKSAGYWHQVEVTF